MIGDWFESADLDAEEVRRLADACDHCPVYRPNGEVVLPSRLRRDGDTVTAIYRCGLCGYTWYTTWSAESWGVTGIPQSSEPLIVSVDRFLRTPGWTGENGGDAA